MSLRLIFICICFLVYIFLAIVYPMPVLNQAQAQNLASTVDSCDPLGWFPTDFGLKDHSVFWYDGYYYLVSIYLPQEQQFAYGRTTDFCHWEIFPPILTGRIPGTWDDCCIWAPFVYEEGGTFYMYYTGVRGPWPNLTQSIFLATTTNPADPTSWQAQGMIFQPNHPGMIWEAGQWADCRDATVFRWQDVYYLYYTGEDITGPIIGIATASSLSGPWTDQGATLAPINQVPMLESPTILENNGLFYLIYNHAHHTKGEEYRLGESPLGPWGDPYRLSPGWAHEVWQGHDCMWYTSYLTNYTVTINHLQFDHFFNPPTLFIGNEVYHTLVPFITK